jgi:ParB/RepB/Spo0J family partition protein
VAEVLDLPLAAIDDGDNDRTVYAAGPLRALADSMAAVGLAQPITVRPRPGGRFEIVAGHRRRRAAALLGWAAVPAIVRELDDEAAASIMLAENAHRVDLNPVDEARAYEKRMRQFGWSVAETARRAKVSGQRVADRLLLLQLLPEAQRLVADGHLGAGFGVAMAPLDANRQAVALRWLQAQQSPTLRAFRAACGALLAQQAQESLFDLDSLLVAAAQGSDDATRSGRNCPFPTHPGIPPFTRRGTLGASMAAYIVELRQSGHAEAALIAATLYAGMLTSGLCHPPRGDV